MKCVTEIDLFIYDEPISFVPGDIFSGGGFEIDGEIAGRCILNDLFEKNGSNPFVLGRWMNTDKPEMEKGH